MPEHSAGNSGHDLVRVMRSDDCPVGTPQEPELRLVSVGTEEMIVVRLTDGEVVAFTSRCPHQGTDLLDASFFDEQLRCPHHLYLYDPRTGENVVPARDARPENLWKLRPGYLPTYKVEEHDGWIWVSPRPSAPPAGYDPDRESRPPDASTPTGAEVDAEPEAPLPSGPMEHPVKTVRVQPGTTFELRLPAPFTVGHVWRVEVPDGLLKVLDERFDPTDPPRHRVTLAASGEGVATVRCAFGRPWEAVPTEIRTYAVHIGTTILT